MFELPYAGTAGRHVDIRNVPDGDEDGDGVSNRNEMLNNTCPWPLPEPPVLTPQQRAARNGKVARRKAEEEAISAALERVRKHTRGVKLTMLPGSRERDNRQRARVVKIQRSAEANAEKTRRAAEKARRPLTWTDSRGVGHALIGVDERGSFRTVQTFSSTQAALTGTDQLWPSGSNPGPLGLSLTGGTGQPLAAAYSNQLAMWEPLGIPRTSHQDFLLSGTSRITTVGSGQDTHATRVASVLAGAGNFSIGGQTSKGMAWRETVKAFAATGFVFSDILSQLPETGVGQVRVHNHSYGEPAGWSSSFHSLLGQRLWWYGDLYLNTTTTESLFFGRYSGNSAGVDEVVRLRPWALPVWAAGNDRDDNPASGPLSTQPRVSVFRQVGQNLVPVGNDFYVAECPDASGAFFCPAVGVANGTDYYEESGWAGVHDGAVILPENLSGVAINSPPVDGGTTGYDSIPQGYGTGKNVLTAGAVDANGALAAYSSCGPCDGGRLKPDVVAVGTSVLTATAASDAAVDADPFAASGTSFAAPAVTGTLGLLAEHYEALSHEMESGSLPTGTDGTRWDALQASTTKALAIHTAADLGNAGPDYQYGWGLLNAVAAVELVAANWQGQQRTFIKEIVLPGDPDGDNYDAPEISFTVRAAGDGPLKVTACWTDPAGEIQAHEVDPPDPTASSPGDSPGEGNGNPNVLINNLDLRIQKLANPQSTPEASGPAEQVLTEYLPWVLDGENPASLAVRGQNDVDNVEQVITTENAVAGALYRVIVRPRVVTALGPPWTVPLYGDPEGGSYPSGPGVEQPVSLVLSGVVDRAMPLEVLSFAPEFSSNGLVATLTWSAVAGETYVIEASTDLQTWTAVSGLWNARLDWCTAESELIAEPLPERLFFRVRAARPFPALQ